MTQLVVETITTILFIVEFFKITKRAKI
ncbi:hypothetical protein ACVXZZ_09845 [Staphylococcus aureus]